MIIKDNMDSYSDTIDHIQKIQSNIADFIFSLATVAVDHDASKLQPPEKELFDKWTPELAKLTYGSDEYKAGMDLIDVIEMLCDWKAAVERHNDGDIRKSLEINRERFGISEQLYSILINTVNMMGW